MRHGFSIAPSRTLVPILQEVRDSAFSLFALKIRSSDRKHWPNDTAVNSKRSRRVCPSKGYPFLSNLNARQMTCMPQWLSHGVGIADPEGKHFHIAVPAPWRACARRSSKVEYLIFIYLIGLMRSGQTLCICILTSDSMEPRLFSSKLNIH